jgi:hypothetical protein
MLLLLFAACRAVFAQDGGGAIDATRGPSAGTLDGQVTIVGRDQAAIPIPRPSQQELVSVPTLDVEPPLSLEVPAVAPPAAAWSAPRAEVLVQPLPTDGHS